MQPSFHPIPLLVAFAIASLGWMTSFDLSRIAQTKSGVGGALWRVAAAAPIGAAVWSLPLFVLPRAAQALQVFWDAGTVALSLLIAVGAAAIGFVFARRAKGRLGSTLLACGMGLGFCSVPIIDLVPSRGSSTIGIGTASMMLPILLGIVASALALRIDRQQRGLLMRSVVAMLLGLCTVAMVVVTIADADLVRASAGSQPLLAPHAWLPLTACFCAALTIATCLLASLFERRLEQLTVRSTRLVQQNEARLQRVLEQLPFGILVADAATGTLVITNHEAHRVMQDLHRDDGRQSSFFPTADAIGDPLSRVLRDEETIDRELQAFRRKDSRAVTLEISAAPIYDENRLMILAIAAFQDVSARVEAEADLRQAQKMEALGQLTGGIAHDTNNLLTAILGNLDLLEPRLADEQQRTLLRNALSATERGAKLTSQLLSFSRRQSLVPCAVDVNQAVAEMSPLLTSTLGGTIQIECVPGENVWPAYADPTQLELVLLNLAINARDAMAGGGSIQICTTNVVLSDRASATEPAPGEYVKLTVRDSGSGMTQATLSRAFEPFFTTKGPNRGSGLGLSQVLGIAQQLGGGVSIESEIGRGTSVHLFMPRSLTDVEAAPAKPATPDLSGTLEGRIILLVDDDDDVRAAARALLGGFGCIVIEESNGRAAVARAAGAERIDMVIIDFAMPGMNGADAGERIRAIRPGIPILVITGYADADQLPGVEGRFPTLQKPFRGAHLAELLPTLLLPRGDASIGSSEVSVVPFSRARGRQREAGVVSAPPTHYSRRDYN